MKDPKEVSHLYCALLDAVDEALHILKKTQRASGMEYHLMVKGALNNVVSILEAAKNDTGMAYLTLGSAQLRQQDMEKRREE